MSRNGTLLMGAVAYDAKVVTIWEGFREYFLERGLDFDYVLYSNYERQVESHLAGHIDVAWNSPLAWLQAKAGAERAGRRAEAICMRDTDQDLTSVVIVREDSDISGLEGLRGRKVGLGARDSPQANLIPMFHLSEAGLQDESEIETVVFDVLVGKHGDHIGGEREAAQALLRGEVDAACIIDGNYLAFSQEGSLPPGSARVLSRTAPYDHCNFTILDGAPPDSIARFRELLLDMSYSDPQVRPLLDLEGLTRWLPGRTEGYAQLEGAVSRFGTIEPFLRGIGA